MMIRTLATAVAFSLLVSGSAFAQAAAPATPAAPAAPAATDATPAAPAMTKQAKSKECSMEADKQGLHGKARKSFRSKCKAGKA